ncbi:MAG: DUF3467 domain-containing protein [Desulfuromonas sp.]|nr:MAG: DUF3467 domain-containing protein [Desulfuromonas sp.]
MEKKQGKEVKLELQLDEAVAGGLYVNMAVVNHNENEFIIDAIFLQPQGPKAKVQARLITSPRHAKQLLAVLQTNVENYEKRFGTINLPAAQTSDTPLH